MGTSFVRDRYEILSFLGHGGQGEVARALDHQHDRVVAMKVIEVGSEFERRGLLREARMLLGLQPHAGLPIVREDFFDEDRYFIVMDWIEGVSLAHVLADRGAPGLPAPEVAEYVIQTAAALDHLHRHEPPVVHQDVKPGNLILVPDGHVVLVDFGLSVPGGSARPTHHGGTRGYAAPELVAGTATTSADVYGLAATAFALLTGGPPKGDLPTWENIPRGAAGRIEPVIRRALSIDPDRRPASAGAFAADLGGAIGGASGERVAADAQIRTFLIADVRGYTTFTKEYGDEAAARLAAAFAEIAREGVEARDGEVIELRGDEALAVFPSARQALRAAAELQVVFQDESRLDPSLPLPVGIGLDAGEAVPMEGGFRGAALNLAARLCSSAGPGEVLASQGVMHLAGTVDGLRLEERVPLDLRGIDGPVPTWQAVHDDAFSGPIGSPLEERRARPVVLLDLPPELDPLTGLVGRDREARWIRWAWRQARRGPGRIVVLTGSEGAGKTLLAAEASRLAAGEGALVVYASARRSSDETGRAIAAAAGSFGPALVVLDDLDVAGDTEIAALAELVDGLDERRLLVVGIARDDAPPRIRAALERLAGIDDRIRRLGPFDRDGVRAVAALYLEETTSEVPVDAIIQATGGAPTEVHRMAVRWAEGEAARRLGGAADVAARGRAGLRTAEADLVDTVIDLQRVREREGLLGSPEGRAAHELPFKGLASFDISDAGYFFGRERLVAEMIARLAGSSILAVVGPSGSGKSSAVRAGLLPALASGALPGSEDWIRAILRPGAQPERELNRVVRDAMPERLRSAVDPSSSLHAVRSAIEDDRGHLLVVVDQAEELFTVCRDDAERQGFVDALTTAVRASGVTVIFAVRADFYGRCAAHPDLAELVAANHVLVGPMTGEEYRRAIELPARRAGLRIDRPLVDALVGEVVDEPGGLPLLSTALFDLWQRRRGRAIRLESHSETGGVRGAVARLAEEAYGDLTHEQRAVAKGVLLRLSTTEDDVVARRRVPIEEFDPETNPDVHAVLDSLIDARLLIADEGSVEVAHEALLREWPRLAGWLDEDRTARRLREHLTEQAKEWGSSGKDSDDLYRGARLVSALDWTAEHTVELNELEREFLSASRQTSERETERERRTNRRLRGLLGGVAAFLALALVAGGLALVQRGRATAEAERAAAQTRLATARELANAAVATIPDDPELSILLAAQAVRTTRAADGSVLPEAEEALHRALIADRLVAATPDFGGWDVDWSPDGAFLAATDHPDDLRRVVLRDASTGRIAREWQADRLAVSDLAFSPDGTMLATAGGSETAIKLWDPSTGRPVRTMGAPADDVWGLSFAGDGSRVAALWWHASEQRQEARIFDVRSGRTLTVIPGLARFGGEALVESAWDVALSPDGSLLAVGVWGAEPAVEIFDVTSGKLVRSIGSRCDFELAWNAERNLLAGASCDGVVRVWDPSSGAHRFTLFLKGSAERIDWSQDGAQLATLETGGKATIWDIESHGGRASLELPVPDVVQGDRSGIAFAPDGDRIVTVDATGVAKVWDVGHAGDAEWLNIETEHPWFGDVAYSPDGRWLVGNWRSRIGVWDAETGALMRTLPGHAPVTGMDDIGPSTIVVSPNGELVASGGRDLTVRVRSFRTGEQLYAFRNTEEWVEDVVFSPDGRVLAFSGFDQTVRLVDAYTGRRIRWLEHNESVLTIQFTPDGSSLVTGSIDGSVRVWDAATGLLTQQIDGGVPIKAIALDPEARRVAVGTTEGVASVWDLSTGDRLATLAGHSGEVWSIAFSPDGSTIATGSDDRTIRLWDPASGVSRFVLRGHRSAVRNLAFSSDGSRLASISQTDVIRVWALDIGDLLVLAEDELSRAFTTEECRQYHLDPCPA